MSPVAVTDATALLLELHEIVWPVIGAPSLPTTVACSCAVSPGNIDAVGAPASVREATVGGLDVGSLPEQAVKTDNRSAHANPFVLFLMMKGAKMSVAGAKTM